MADDDRRSHRFITEVTSDGNRGDLPGAREDLGCTPNIADHSLEIGPQDFLDHGRRLPTFR